MGLPRTAAGFDQIQVQVDLLSGKVYAVPTRSTDTAAQAAQVILDMVLRSGDGVPDVLVVDHDPKFTSAVFQEFTRRLGSNLVVGSAFHKNTNAKVERTNGVIGDTLRAFANGRKDDWDQQLPFAVFAINNAPSAFGGELSPFFIDRGRHPRLPASLPDVAGSGETPAMYAAKMKALEEEVRNLLHAAQQERKAALDVGRVDTVFRVGDRVMLRTKELLDAAEIGKLRPRWEGPFTIKSLAGPNAYTLALPSRFRGSPKVNVDRLKPYADRAGSRGSSGPVPASDRAGEFVVEQILLKRRIRGRVHYLVRWQGCSSADDSWEPEEHLTRCAERLAEYEAAAAHRHGSRHARPSLSPTSATLDPPNPTPPHGFLVTSAPVGAASSGQELIGRHILYWWPEDGWQHGVVTRGCRRAPFSHVVTYRRTTSALAGAVDTLLDTPSYGSRWVLLSPHETPTENEAIVTSRAGRRGG
jgi:hypothetical protein